MHLRIFARVDFSSLILNQRVLTLEEPCKLYTTCWIKYIFICVYLGEVNVLDFYHSLKRLNAITQRQVCDFSFNKFGLNSMSATV